MPLNPNQIKIFLLILLIAFQVAAQSSPVAIFTTNKVTGCNPLTIEFINNSTGAVSYLWQFGNGDSSTAGNPTITYFNPGNYSVTLIAYSATNQSDTLFLTDLIQVSQRPDAEFSINNNEGCANGNPILFTNNSIGASTYTWDFGDGNSSSQLSPSHIYSNPGTYTVALIATGQSGCTDIKLMSQYISISAMPSADFSADTTKSCSLNHIFQFQPAYFNGLSYQWNFHDGSYSSQTSPSHAFISPGKYTVSLEVTNTSGCSNSLTKASYITVSDTLAPSIVADVNSGCAPLNVNFSANNLAVSSYSWDFGDGSSSTDPGPVHSFTDTGMFTVSLTVSDLNNCQFSTVAYNLINTNDPIKADFVASQSEGCAPLPVSFTNHSASPGAHFWNFGDGSTDTAFNPVHIYSSPGNYTVTLMETDGTCQSSVIKTGLVTVLGPAADFIVNNNSGCIPLTVNFTDFSVNTVQWQWNFGDGSTSNSQHPTHTYNSSGNFTVSLIAFSNNGCSDTLMMNDLIQPVDPYYSFDNIDTVFSCNEINASFNGSDIGTDFWLWDFGDGTSDTVPNPVHTYTQPGIYTVTLTTQTVNGCTITINNFNVYKIENITADFNIESDTCAGENAYFSSLSPSAVDWHWNFGDGTSSASQNPSHSYASAGVYSVALTIFTDNGCSFSVMKNNIISLSSCDTASGSGGGGIGFGNSGGSGGGTNDSTLNYFQLTGCAPFHAYFTNPFDSAISSYWLFGDGDTSTAQNPFHVYKQEGIYDVMLTVTFPDNSSYILNRENFIKVNKVIAGFAMAQSNSCDGSQVAFTNNSVNASVFTWNFGDSSTTDAVVDPIHNYDDAGNYLVSLQASDEFGCNNISVKNIFAGIVVPVIHFDENLCINDTVVFTSNMNNFYSYQWDFGDGTTSSLANPSHSYDSAGSFLVSLTAFDSSGCSFTNLYPAYIQISNPMADFSISDSEGCDLLMGTFNNLSLGSDSWHWDFGDSTFSLTQNPVHIYSMPGVYDVTLFAMKNGCISSKTVQNAITVHASEADFSFSQNTLCFPVSVTFSDSSTNAISWMWDFGDGLNDTIQNPTHTFTEIPTADISLTIEDTNGCTATVVKDNIQVFVAGMSVDTSQGCDSLTVNFMDLSAGALSWTWDFGDGSPLSNLKNPAHYYADSGLYTITLIAESPDGCFDTTTFENYISIYKVIADFSTPSTTSGCNPLLVNFQDSSLNATQWNWNFGDGSNSIQQHPWHIYSIPGTYDVTLIASNAFGCSDTALLEDFVQATGPLAYFNLAPTEGCAPLEIQFIDSSLNNASGLSWFFGDGSPLSSVADPSHHFDSAGTFEITLLVWDSTGCSSYYTSPNKIVVHPSPSAEFTGLTTSGCAPLEVFFDAKFHDTDSVQWIFGDGKNSDFFSGPHIFRNAGLYNPVLITSNHFGCMDTFNYASITVHATPSADFYSESNKGCSPLPVNFINNSEGLDSAVYQWHFGNGETSSTENPSSTYFTGGIYDVQLIVTNHTGCTDTLTRAGFVFAYDNFPPRPSEILVATVSSPNSVMIVWNETIAADFEKYILYRRNNLNGPFSVVAEFNDPGITSYTDNNLNTPANAYCYKIQSVDFCGNSISIDELTEYCTINVNAYPDSASILVEWTPYRGCEVSKYEILRADKNSTDFKHLAFTNPGILNFEDTSWHCFTEYTYQVRGLDLCGKPINTLSDTSLARADESFYARQQVEIIRSTVIGNSVYTEWKSPSYGQEKVTAYKIFRSPGNQKFELIGLVGYGINSYVDEDVQVNEKNYYYKIETVNVCGIKSLLSNNSSSILLESEKSEYEVKLKWTPYKTWEDGVDQYIIQRLDENGQWQLIKIVEGNIHEFTDDLLK